MADLGPITDEQTQQQTTWRYRVKCLSGHGWAVSRGGYSEDQEAKARADVRAMAQQHVNEYGSHTFVGYWERESQEAH